MSLELFKCRWGILATGGIARVFTKDLLIDPALRGGSDVKHVVAAAASSTSVDRARAFLKEIGAPDANAYGTYEELVADPSVDIIYVATPHSHHFQNCLLALNANKPTICEKPFTVNAAQTKILVDIARKKRLFLMEAVWTRYLPISIELRSLVRSRRIGEVRRVIADLSLAQGNSNLDSHRMVNPDLAGGALLDLGLYPLTWVYQILYHTLPEAEKKAPVVTGTISKYERTGVDADNVVVATFPRSIGIATSSIRVATDPGARGSVAVKIQGTEGEIQVAHPAYRPQSYTIIPNDKNSKPETRQIPVPVGYGMYWEADTAARCLRDGKLESDIMPLDESILIMEAMDKVREIGDFRYPEKIESTDY
ncbi:NAD(P)-binding protein [Choiromyces venosus 120613-1]|uniref:D-xylose 1-dehydrogenase (NADP(+), D-xylono-1,5-lactone-forming) n=1 Tax=Choiromyces venosus 120613-1 TaxID=1336337 RepID=A0A3N4JP22_9PEZI|nr:NAD(P)-binding protein [Choiromyces venosus 120613-1]